MARRKQFKLSYPKAIAVAIVFSAFVVTQLQGPRQRPSSHRRNSVAPVKAQVLNNESPSKEQLLSKLAQTSEQPELQTAPLLGIRGSSCSMALSKLAIHPKIKSVKNVKGSRKAVRIARIKRPSKKRTLVLPQWINDDLEKSALNSQDALDNPAPLDEIAMNSFKEVPLEEGLSSHPLLAEAQLSKIIDPEFPFDMEMPMRVRESLFQKMAFDDLQNSLGSLRDAVKADELHVMAPKSEVAWNQLPSEAIVTVAQNEEQKSSENSESASEYSDQKLNVVAAAPVESPKFESHEQGIPSKVNPALSLGPNLAQASGSDVLEALVGAGQKLMPAPAGLSTRAVTTQPSTKVTPTSVANVAIQNSNVAELLDESLIEGKIYGELSVDPSTETWIRSRRAHIELYLNRVGSRDPQDTIYIHDFRFPGSGNRFELDGTGIRGKYNLLAGIYVPESSVPIAQIIHPNVISPETYREKIRLHISRTMISETSTRLDNSRRVGTIPLNLTVFDGAPANYRMPKVIKGAEISLVGFEHQETLVSDKDGNIRIPEVPNSSEIIIEAKAAGYYPTRMVVPTFSVATYQPIYLIEKDKVDAITRYFTKKPQLAQKSLVMGRVYDSHTRAPLAGETLMLSHRRGSAVYFGALPDLNANATLDTGLFGFYNVEPSFRAIGRGPNRSPLLLNMESGFGYFLEFGRGGARNFNGRLFDPFNNQSVQGSVQIVGNYLPPINSGDSGRFQISGLDLPSGLVTIEVNADGYPRTWFTVPWSTREPEKERTFYLMERDLIKESAIRLARVKHEKNTGVVAGGIQGNLFGNENSSFGIELVHMNGTTLAEGHGPFSLSQITPKNKSFQVTPKNPGFAFFNVPPGEYLLKILSPDGKIFRTHVVRVGVERVSVVIN